MVFMKQVYSLSAWSQISKAYVTYKASGIDDIIKKENFPCSYDRYLQNVELNLICQGKKGIGYQ